MQLWVGKVFFLKWPFWDVYDYLWRLSAYDVDYDLQRYTEYATLGRKGVVS